MFEATFDYTGNLRPAWATQLDIVLEEIKKGIKEQRKVGR